MSASKKKPHIATKEERLELQLKQTISELEALAGEAYQILPFRIQLPDFKKLAKQTSAARSQKKRDPSGGMGLDDLVRILLEVNEDPALERYRRKYSPSLTEWEEAMAYANDDDCEKRGQSLESRREGILQEEIKRVSQTGSLIKASIAAFAPTHPLADASSAKLLQNGLDIASFSDPRLSSFRSGSYSIWDLGLIAGSQDACRFGASLWLSRGKSPLEGGAVSKPKNEPLTTPNPLISAFRIDPYASGLSLWRGNSTPAALASFMACWQGLSQDPEAFFAEALSFLGKARFPVCEPSLAQLGSATQNEMSWHQFPKNTDRSDKFFQLTQAFAASCALSIKRFPSAEFGDFPIFVRASGILSSPSSIAAMDPPLSDLFRAARSSMAETAMAIGDEAALSALTPLGISFRDYGSQASSSHATALHPIFDPRSLRDRLLSRGFPFPLAAFALERDNASSWASLGALDALAIMALHLRRVKNPQVSVALELAKSFSACEPFPGACSGFLSALADSCPSDALQTISDAIAVEYVSAGRAPAASRNFPRAL